MTATSTAEPRLAAQRSKGARRAVERAVLAVALLAVAATFTATLLASRAASNAVKAEAKASLATATAAAGAARRARAGVSERSGARRLREGRIGRQHQQDEEQSSPRRHHGSSRRKQQQQQREWSAEQTLTQPIRPGLRSSWAIEEEEASWQVAPRYSTHTCIGPKPDDRWQAATCKFDNVCLNASTLEFEYYQDTLMYPSMPVAYDQLGARPQEQFSEHLLSSVHWMMDKNKTASWRPVVKRQPFPQMGERVRWAPVPQALLQAYPQRFLVNFGHVMFDLAVPLFNAQHLFGIYRPNAQVLVLNETLNDRWDEVAYYMERMINTKTPDRSLFRLSWNSDALWLREYTRQVLGDDGDGLVCFRTLLAGTGNLTRRGRSTDALPYRAAVAERLGLDEAPFGAEEQPVITMLDKDGRRIIENYGEIQQMLEGRYPQARVQLMDFGKHPDLTMAEQVQLMSETTILISPCGGLATVLAFLRPGSTAIVMNFWHTLLNRSIMMEDAFYSNLEYLDLQYFPVTPADYEGTSDRPECELQPNGTRRHDSRYPQSGALVNCNLYFGPEAKQRMLNYVDQAMMRWAAKRGRYDVIEPLRALRAAELAAGGDAQGSAQVHAADGAAAAVAAEVEVEVEAAADGLDLEWVQVQEAGEEQEEEAEETGGEDDDDVASVELARGGPLDGLQEAAEER